MVKLTYESVRERFIKQNYTLISTEYIHQRDNLLFKCNKCDHIYNRTLMHFRNMKSCSNCNGTIQNIYTYEFVKNYFKKEECQLLET